MNKFGGEPSLSKVLAAHLTPENFQPRTVPKQLGNLHNHTHLLTTHPQGNPIEIENLDSLTTLPQNIHNDLYVRIAYYTSFQI